MLLTKWMHSCVRLEHGGRSLLLDPGTWTEDAAFAAGADAVLVTHEHHDHVDVDRVGALGVPVVAPAGADLDGLAAERVRAGDTFSLNGFRVRAVGGTHLPVLPDRPPTANLGWVVTPDGAPDEESVYHPGDALAVPDGPVGTLLVPMQGSWLLTRDAIGFVRQISPRRAIGVHDGQINDRAVRSIGWWLGQAAACGFQHVPPGTVLDLAPSGG